MFWYDNIWYDKVTFISRQDKRSDRCFGFVIEVIVFK